MKANLPSLLFLLVLISNSSVAVLPGEEEGACALPSASSSQSVPEELKSDVMREFGNEDISNARMKELNNQGKEMIDSIVSLMSGGKLESGCTYCSQAVFEI